MKSFAIPYHNTKHKHSDQSKSLPSSAASATFSLSSLSLSHSLRQPAPHNKPNVPHAIPATVSHNSFSHRATAFFKSPLRFQSGASLNSSYSAGAASHDSAATSNTSSTDSYPISHPYAAMVSAPLPVVSAHEGMEEEEECPVCLEPLSFSFRLPGEKPHIVPDCGHALHEVRPIRRSMPFSPSL